MKKKGNIAKTATVPAEHHPKPNSNKRRCPSRQFLQATKRHIHTKRAAPQNVSI